MRAWVLILAVLTTLKPITQVVSTEGNINLYNNTDTKTKYKNENINISSPVILNNNNSININNNQSNSSQNNNSNININILYNNNKYINNSQNKLNISRINSTNNNNNNNNENNSTLINNKLDKDKHITNNNHNQNSSKNNNENINNISNNNNNNNIENIENLTTNNIKEKNENIISKSSEMQINNYDTIESEEDINSNINEKINNLDSNDKLKPDPETLVQIETSLLSLFGLKKPPKIDRSKIVIPEAMKRLYAQLMGHEYDTVTIPKPGLPTHSANTVRSFTHESSDTDEKFKHYHKFRLFFNVNSIPNEEKLKAAELHISRDKIEFDNPNIRQKRHQRFRVSVYDIIKIGNNNKNNKNYQHGDKSYLLLDTKTIYLNSSDTLNLDVHTAVNRWLESPDDNNGLLIEVKTSRTLKPARHNHVRLRRSLNEKQTEWLPKQPLLFTYTDDNRHKTRLIRDVNSQRSKRAHHTRNGHHRRKNTICQRRPLYVDFHDVGWSDWIVAPPGYDAYYCQGDCPFPLTDHLNSTNHAVVQTLVNSIEPAKVPKACCIPTQLSAISMLYLNDQDQVVLKNYQDMTVVGCGCR